MSELKALLPSYAIYCIASEKIQGYAGSLVLIHRTFEPLLSNAPVSQGSSVPVIYVETLGMDDPDGRIISLELPVMWIVGVYAPATGDEVR